MVPKKGQQNCTQQVWETHDAPVASENFSILKIMIGKTNILLRESPK